MFRRFLAEPLQDLANPPRDQNPSLDVLRSLAILGVVATHANTTFAALDAGPSLWSRSPFVRGGWSGVDLFFALSGYLIGRQIWREAARTGKVDIGRFMIRRGFRIWPLYFAVLLLTIFVVRPELRHPSRFWGDVLFISNYIPGTGVVDGGWSLCIEEQFYIFAPLLITLTMARAGSVAAYRRWLIGLLAILPLVRAACWWWVTSHVASPTPDDRIWALYFPFHTHADGLVMGMLIANLEATGSLQKGRGLLGSAWLVPLAAVLCGVCYAVSATYFNYTGFALVFGATIVFCLTRADSLPGIVRAKVFFWISRLSFGTYLVHQWFRPSVLDGLTAVLDPKAAPTLFSFLNFALLALVGMAVALLTYCLIEHPFLRIRERILHPAPRPERLPAAEGIDRATA